MRHLIQLLVGLSLPIGIALIVWLLFLWPPIGLITLSLFLLMLLYELGGAILDGND